MSSKSEQAMDEIKRIEQLRKELHEHNYRYYVLNQPTIGDQEFDFMMHELQALEAKHPEVADPNSPTQRVGSDLNEEFQQVVHKYPMLSLANTYNEQDVADWYESVKKGLAPPTFLKRSSISRPLATPRSRKILVSPSGSDFP